MSKFYNKFFLLFFIACLLPMLNYAQSVGGTVSGSAVLCDTTQTGFLSLVGNSPSPPSTITWEYSTNGGVTWINNGNPTNTQNYNYTGVQTTCYRAIVTKPTFAPDTSTVGCITYYLPSIGGTVTGAGTFCSGTGNGTLTLTGNRGNPTFWEHSIDNGATWINDANTTTTLNYTNISQNTLYHAVVQNGSTCPSDTSTQSAFVIDAPSVGGIVTANDTVCYGINSGSLNLSGNFGVVTNWLSSTDNGLTWTTLSNTAAMQSYSGLTQSTIYEAVVKNGSCNSDTSSSASILVVSPTPVNAGNDTIILSGASATLHGTGGPGTIIWSPGIGLSSNAIFTPVATPALTTTYLLSVTDTLGCISSDAVTITVILPVFSGIVSNLFTPNGDGINDTWYIQDIQGYPENEVFVYNIYGNKVFEKKGYSNDWQGTYNGAELPDGTYYYILKVDDKSDVIKGSLDILRNK
jgi:gliding motility-associated-like protein